MDSVFTDTIQFISQTLSKVRSLTIITSALQHAMYIHVGLPAAESDIRVGDIIMEVESTDVTRANGDLVVSIVRYMYLAVLSHFKCSRVVDTDC